MVGPLTYQYWGDPARINAWLQNAQNADLLATGALQGLYGSTWNSFPVIAVGWIIQWALGLRAAATVAGERERGTWDGLLVSMLEGREIIRAKILGSLASLRGLLASAVTCWTVALACGAMGIADYLIAVSTMFVVGTFMVAAGVYNSLSASAAGRATTRTLVVWIASFAADGALWVVAAFATMALAAVAGIFRLLLGVQLTPAGPMGMFSYVVVVFSIVRLGAYALATFLVAAYCRRHFAKLAGRTREFVAVDARGRSIRTPAPVVAEIVDAT
jgi:ABC-type Na+ efflux pump permease subunit